MRFKNSIQFRLWGRYALFTDPVTKIGGEKCSYHIPTYEALKGVARSIYWKPTFIWVIDRLRVLNPIRTQTKSVKLLKYNGGGSDLSIYNYLSDVAYQVEAHFEWNEQRPELEEDRSEEKHFSVAKRMLERGGRQDVFLGVRDCQGYVEPSRFGEGASSFDGAGELAFGLMFHGFDYPSETGKNEYRSRFWSPKLVNGVLEFPRPEECPHSKLIREGKMNHFKFEPGINFSGLSEEGLINGMDAETI